MPQSPASRVQRRPSTPRWRRANVVLGKVIPLLLLSFAVSSIRLVYGSVVPLVYSRNRLSGTVYCAWVSFALAMTGWSYFLVYFQSRSPPAEKEPPLAVREKRTIYACDETGEPLRCFRDHCGGAWRSIRTRHCADCGTCRPGFDHHCGFMDNCVATNTFKPFFTFLVYAALLLSVALVPLLPLQYRAVREVIQQTWSAEYMRKRWWSRWVSWAGGPVWRYAGALLLGIKHYSHLAPTRPLLVSDTKTVPTYRDGITYTHSVRLYPALSTPTLSSLLVVVFATLIFLIAVATRLTSSPSTVIVVIVRNTRSGVSAIQLERTRRSRLNTAYDARSRLWVPLPLEENERGGEVVLVDPSVPLFDLGPGENWRRAMGERWWEWSIPMKKGRGTDFDFNPTTVASLEAQARKQQ